MALDAFLPVEQLSDSRSALGLTAPSTRMASSRVFMPETSVPPSTGFQPNQFQPKEAEVAASPCRRSAALPWRTMVLVSAGSRVGPPLGSIQPAPFANSSPFHT